MVNEFRYKTQKAGHLSEYCLVNSQSFRYDFSYVDDGRYDGEYWTEDYSNDDATSWVQTSDILAIMASYGVMILTYLLLKEAIMCYRCR